MNWQRKARSGDPVRISATAYNKFIDTAIAVEEMRRAGLSPGKHTKSATHVLVRNESAGAIPPWTPLHIASASSASLLREEPILQVIYESGALSQQARASVVVSQEFIGTGEVRLAVAAGVTYCKIGQLLPGETVTPGTTLSLRTGFLTADTNGCATLIANIKSLGNGSYLGLVRLGVASGHFYARIGEGAQDGNAARWLYPWQEVALDDANEWQDMLAGRSSAKYGTARNILEAANTSNTAYSIAVTPPLFEINGTGVRFRRVPTNTIVEMHLAQRSDNRVFATFSAPNPVWGPCASAAFLNGESNSPTPGAE